MRAKDFEPWFRLQGLDINPVPSRYPNLLWSLDSILTVNIFSTADGDAVKCDVDDHRTYGNRVRQKLIEDNCVTEVPESFVHKTNNAKWRGKYDTYKRTSGSDDQQSKSPAPDSGHVSDSSYDATANYNWVDLKDNSTDSGIMSGTLLNPSDKTFNLRGPANPYICTVMSQGIKVTRTGLNSF